MDDRELRFLSFSTHYICMPPHATLIMTQKNKTRYPTTFLCFACWMRMGDLGILNSLFHVFSGRWGRVMMTSLHKHGLPRYLYHLCT